MKFEIENGLVQFLSSDLVGKYAEVSAPGKRDFSLNFRSGVFKQVTFVDFGSKPKAGARVYFDDAGVLLKVVAPPKADKAPNEGAAGLGEGSIRRQTQAW